MIDLRVSINKNTDVFGQLETTLHSWLHVIQEYTFRVPKVLENPENKDYCWWYGERPQIGFLAIACWLNGWAALEEWGTKKQSSHGRNDLWIGRGSIQMFIEAKYKYLYVHYGKNEVNTGIQEILSKAKNAASSLKDDVPGFKIGAAFITPVWHPIDTPDFDTARKQWVEACSMAADAVAMIVPHQDECPKDDNQDFCIGSALLLSKV